MGATLISGDGYASEDTNYSFVRQAYKDRYPRWDFYTMKSTRLRDGIEWKVVNALIGKVGTNTIKTILKEYIDKHFSSATPDVIQSLILIRLANPEYALAHQFVKAKDYDGLKLLLKITGPEVLLIPDTSGRKPLSEDESLDSLDAVFKEIGLAEGNKIAKELKDTFLKEKLTLIKEKVTSLIMGINEAKATITLLEPNWSTLNTAESRQLSGAQKTLREKEQALSVIIESSPQALEGQKLEEFDKYFRRIAETPEGRKLLRDYRLSDRSSLISYYVKEHQNASDWQEKDFVENNFRIALAAYFEDNVPITSDVIDISDVASLRFFLHNAGDKGAKQTLSQYRNRRGYNFAQLILTLEEESGREGGVTHLRDLMQQDKEAFLNLLRQASSGTDTAEVMMMQDDWGNRFLIELDPAIWVRPGKFRVTPLMKTAFEMNERDFQALFARLRQNNGITDFSQVDLFGNSVDSIRGFKLKHQWFESDEFLVESLKNRPLQESLWTEFAEFPYFETTKASIKVVLDAVRKQLQSPLHHAFFQVEVDHDQVRVNSLWRSLFKAVDEREDRILAPAERRKRISEIQERVISLSKDDWQRLQFDREVKRLEGALSIRKLSVAERALGFLSVEQSPDAVENMLANGGTFGINFSRKLSPLAGSIVMKRCQELGQRFGDKMQSDIEKSNSPAYIVKILNDDFGLGLTEDTFQRRVSEVEEKLRVKFSKPTADIQDLFPAYLEEKGDIKRKNQQIAQQITQKLKNSLFRDFGSILDPEKTRKLLNHRLNCAVVTLFAFMAPHPASMRGSDIDQIFTEIDTELKGYLPAGRVVNSKARFERLNNLYGDGFQEIDAF
ncbi:MAG: hypothetical protein K2Q34_02440 [Alphaproteobacteria bacterium]|nr:hypothetical protein [Alphaproteobacteria bacterium]